MTSLQMTLLLKNKISETDTLLRKLIQREEELKKYETKGPRISYNAQTQTEIPSTKLSSASSIKKTEFSVFCQSSLFIHKVPFFFKRNKKRRIPFVIAGSCRNDASKKTQGSSKEKIVEKSKNLTFSKVEVKDKSNKRTNVDFFDSSKAKKLKQISSFSKSLSDENPCQLVKQRLKTEKRRQETQIGNEKTHRDSLSNSTKSRASVNEFQISMFPKETLNHNLSLFNSDVFSNKEKENQNFLLTNSNTTSEDISGTKNDISGTKNDISGTNEDISVTNEDISVTSEDISVTSEDISVASEDISLSNQDITLQNQDSYSQNEDRTYSYQDSYSSKKNTVLQNEDRTLQNQDSYSSKKITVLQNEDRTLQNENRTLQKEDRTLQNEDITLQNEDRTLQNEDRTLQNEDRTLQNEDRTLQKEDRTLQNEDRTLQNEDRTLQNEDITLQNEDRTLQNKNTLLVNQDITLLHNQDRYSRNQNSLYQNQEIFLTTEETSVGNQKSEQKNSFDSKSFYETSSLSETQEYIYHTHEIRNSERDSPNPYSPILIIASPNSAFDEFEPNTFELNKLEKNQIKDDKSSSESESLKNVTKDKEKISSKRVKRVNFLQENISKYNRELNKRKKILKSFPKASEPKVRQLHVKAAQIQFHKLWKNTSQNGFEEIVHNLSKIQDTRIIFDFIYMAIKNDKVANSSESLSSFESGLPPLCSLKQKKIISLLIALSKNNDRISFEFLRYTEYSIFGKDKMLNCKLGELCNLVRVFVTLCRYFGLEERVKIFLYDILFFNSIRNHAMILSIILTWPDLISWPGGGGEELIDPIFEVFIWIVYNAGPPWGKTDFKIFECRKLIHQRCSLVSPYAQGSDLARKLIIKVEESASSDTKDSLQSSTIKAFLLLAKVQGYAWTNSHIVAQLLSLLQNPEVTSDHLAWVVESIGAVSRVYPVEGREHLRQMFCPVKNLLCQNPDSFLGSKALSALTLLAHHLQQQFVEFLYDWTPSFEPSKESLKSLQNFLGTRGSRFANGYLSYKNPFLISFKGKKRKNGKRKKT